MLIVAVATFLADEVPAVSFNHLDNVSHLHHDPTADTSMCFYTVRVTTNLIDRSLRATCVISEGQASMGVHTLVQVSFNFRSDKAVVRESTADEMSAILRPGNVVFNTVDPERLSEFWAALTGYEPRTLFGTNVGLRDPSGRGPNLTFQQCDAPDVRGGSCHVDFYADDPDDVAERALQLGGDLVRRVSEGGVRWVVLTDPDGNEFCVVVSGPDRSP